MPTDIPPTPALSRLHAIPAHSLECVLKRHIISLQPFPGTSTLPEVKQGACKELEKWLELAHRYNLELDPFFLRRIKDVCRKGLRATSNAAATRESCGEALKFALRLKAAGLVRPHQASTTVAIDSGQRPIQPAKARAPESGRAQDAGVASGRPNSGAVENERTDAEKEEEEEDQALFKVLLSDLKVDLDKTTAPVKVKGVVMSILGTLYTQYSSVIAGWKRKRTFNAMETVISVQEEFLTYLDGQLNKDDGMPPANDPAFACAVALHALVLRS